jgi:hypothetical protein
VKKTRLAAAAEMKVGNQAGRQIHEQEVKLQHSLAKQEQGQSASAKTATGKWAGLEKDQETRSMGEPRSHAQLKKKSLIRTLRWERRTRLKPKSRKMKSGFGDSSGEIST